VFSVLPFGLASTPYVLTKNTEGKTLERAGYPYFYQLGRWAGTKKSLNIARAASRRIREDIAASGFVAHPEK